MELTEITTVDALLENTKNEKYHSTKINKGDDTFVVIYLGKLNETYD